MVDISLSPFTSTSEPILHHTVPTSFHLMSIFDLSEETFWRLFVPLSLLNFLGIFIQAVETIRCSCFHSQHRSALFLSKVFVPIVREREALQNPQGNGQRITSALVQFTIGRWALASAPIP